MTELLPVKEIKGCGDIRYLKEYMEEEGIPARGVLHIGAHDGEEVDLYHAIGFPTIMLVEPDVRAALRTTLKHPHVEILAVAVTSGTDPLVPWVMESNTHQSHVHRLDGSFPPVGLYVGRLSLADVQQRSPNANVLVVDVSGTELDVLRSGALSTYDVIVVETDTTGAYASRDEDVRTYMYSRGYVPHVRWAHGVRTYADVVYRRAEDVHVG